MGLVILTTYMRTLLNAMSLLTEHYECDEITKDSIEDQYDLEIVMLECHYADTNVMRSQKTALKTNMACQLLCLNTTMPICQLNASFKSSIVMLS